MTVEGNSNMSFDQGLRWVGDLDHPFYRDERQRFVWYEASAIGFQMLLLLQLLVSGLALLVFGSDALFVLVGLLPVVLTSLVVIGYTNRRGAQYFVHSSDLRRSRGVAGAVIVTVLAAGLVRVGLDAQSSGETGGFGGGLFLGAAIGLVAGVVGLFVTKQRRHQTEAGADD